MRFSSRLTDYTLWGALLALLSVQHGCGSIERHTFVIPADAQEGWVVVEMGRPDCSGPVSSREAQVYRIPNSRYLCTSRPLPSGLVWERFELIGPNGKTTRLIEGRDIHQSATFRMGSPQSQCNVIATVFYYGRTVKSDPSEVIRRVRPECHTSP